MWWLFIGLIICTIISPTSCFFNFNMYCGGANCYQLLGVSRKVTKAQLTNAYKRIQAKFKAESSNGETDKKFKDAYKILSDIETRKHYDYMLENPNNILYNHYQYFKFVVSPNVSLQILLVVGIGAVSLIQYLYKKHSYWLAVRNALKNPKNRSKALHKVQEKHLSNDTTTTDDTANKKMTNKEKRERRKKEEDRALRQIVQQSIKYRRPPQWRDTLFVQLLFSPYFFIIHMKRVLGKLTQYEFFREEYEDLASLKNVKRTKVEPWSRNNNSLGDLDVDGDSSRAKTEEWIKSNID